MPLSPVSVIWILILTFRLCTILLSVVLFPPLYILWLCSYFLHFTFCCFCSSLLLHTTMMKRCISVVLVMVMSAVSFISLQRNAPLMNDHSDHSHATHRDLSIRSRKTKPRPNIFTFYEPLTQDVGGIQGTGMSVKDDNLLLLTWQREWRKAGWNPIILTLAILFAR